MEELFVSKKSKKEHMHTHFGNVAQVYYSQHIFLLFI